MGKVIAGFSMSLDGFVAAPDDSVPYIFDWYGSGPVRFDWPGNDMTSDVTSASAEYLRDLVEHSGALVVGRRVFDYGVASAIELARAEAGDKAVGVAGPNIAQQCLDLGLLDEIRVELAPVLLGTGIPFFANLARTPVVLENPTVIEGDRVTHLIYPVRK